MLLFQPYHRPALTLGAVERSHPTMSVHTHPRPPCSWEPSLVAPCLAWPQQVPPLNISVNLLMRFLMMCLCPRGGRWPRLPLARDTFSSKYAGNKCQQGLYILALYRACNLESLQLKRTCFGKQVDDFDSVAHSHQYISDMFMFFCQQVASWWRQCNGIFGKKEMALKLIYYVLIR